MTCPLCDIVEGKGKALKLYEDDHLIAILHPYPVVEGHILIFPKEHAQIITTVPDEVVVRMYAAAQRLATVVFDGLGAEGTNIIMHNGGSGQTLAHCTLHVIPRKQGDGLNFEWQPQQMPPEQLDAVLESFTSTVKELEAIANVIKPKEGEENYMLKARQRIP